MPGNELPDQGDDGSGSAFLPGRIEYLITLLSDDNEQVRWRAAESLGRIGSPAAVGPLIDTLWDDDARVRLKAAWALGQIGDPGAVAPLRRLYRMESDDAREIIQEALESIQMAGLSRTE